ncbi:MAG: prolyl oligopeptidase family serine peptidase [Pseudomonadota bacterium]
MISRLVRHAVLAIAGCAVGIVSVASAQQQPAPVPLEVFALREVIRNVTISPDGKRLALMKIDSRKGDPIVEVYETDDLSKRPFRLGADPMEFQSISWVSDDLLVFNAQQRMRRRIEGYNRGVFSTRVASYNFRTKKFETFGSNAQLESVLPKEPNKVIISEGRSVASFGQDDPAAAFRPRAYYELNLETGSKSLIIKGNDARATVQFDSDGNPRSAFGFDAASQEAITYGRLPGENNWEEVLRRSIFELEDFNIVAFDHEDPKLGYVITTNGKDVYGLWKYDFDQKKIVEEVYVDSDADIFGLINHPNSWSRPGEVAGFTYYGAKPQAVFFDPEVEAIYTQLQEVIPNAHNVTINSMSRDGSTYIVFNTGPRDPGTYYMVRNGGLQLIGSHSPLIRPEQLSDVEFVEYESRDGRTVRGYITIPSVGEPPYPTIAMPHGGPFVGEMPAYDEWAQMLASRGYMVFQPQYLGSRGWGHKHYIEFFQESGFRMQDDKDDGMMELVRRGLADKDRLAMFGWSYGGYASAVAATRTPQIHQCVLPAAAVLDTQLQKGYGQRNANEATKYFFEQWLGGDVINPIEEVDKINVPMLLIHGDVDQRVPYEHFKRYRREIEKSSKKDMVQYLVLPEADHFSVTLYYRHQLALYEGMIDFLKNDCGPGGL